MKSLSKGKARRFLSKGIAMLVIAAILLGGLNNIIVGAAMNPTVQDAINNDSTITNASFGMDLSNNPNIYGDVDVQDLVAVYPNLTYLNLSGTNVNSVSNAGGVTVTMSDTFANGARSFVVPSAVGISYSESATADLNVAELLAQVRIQRAGGTNIAIPSGMLGSGTVSINGVSYTVSPSSTIAKADVLANAAGTYSVGLNFPIANSTATMTANVNLAVRKSGYTLTTVSGATGASVSDGGTVDIVLKKFAENGQQIALGNVGDYDYVLAATTTHNLTIVSETRSSDGMQIAISVQAAQGGATSVQFKAYNAGTTTNPLAEIEITKYSNEAVTAIELVEYPYVLSGNPGAGTLVTGDTVFLAGGTSISSKVATNLNSYTTSTMYLLKGTFSSSAVTYIPANYAPQITVAIGADASAAYDLEGEIVKVNDPNGGSTQVLALIVKAKTPTATIYAYDGTNNSTKPVTVILGNAGAAANAEIYLDVQVTGNTAQGYSIYQIPSIYATYDKTQIENAVNGGDSEVSLVSKYGFDTNNQWTELVNNGATIVEDATIYLVALAYYEANGQLFIIPDSQINGWYYDQVNMNNMFDSTTGSSAFGGTSMAAWEATVGFSSNTTVLAVQTDGYEATANPELAANLLFAPNGAANNVPVKITKIQAEVTQYIIVPNGYALGTLNAYEKLRLEIDDFVTNGTVGTLYRLNVLGEDSIAIGGTNTYYVMAVYSNYLTSDSYAAVSVADDVTLNNWTSSTKPAEVIASGLTDNHFDVKATTNAGALDALVGRSFDITYGDGTISSATVTITITKSVINGVYLVYEDYFGNLYSSAPALYDNFSDIKKLDFNFEIPVGTTADVYAVYSFSNEQYYAGVTNWKACLVSPNNWSATGTANLTVGTANTVKGCIPVTGAAMITGDVFTGTPGFAIGNSVTVGGTAYSVEAVTPATDDIDVIAPLVIGISAYDAASTAIVSGTPLSGTGYTVGDSFDTNPDVLLTGSGVSPTGLSALVSGTDYTGIVTLLTTPTSNTTVTGYALNLIAGGTTTVTYRYAYTINGQSKTVTIADILLPANNYTFDVVIAKATIEEVFLVVKNSSHGTLSNQGNGVYTLPYTLGSKVDVYPVAMNSLVRLDSNYATFAGLNYISDSVLIQPQTSSYFSYIKAADVALGSGAWAFTPPALLSSISATAKTDASGYLYYEVMFTDEILNANRLNIDFDPAFITLNTTSPYSSVAATSIADAEIYHLVDSTTAYVVDVQATGGSATPYSAGSPVNFTVEYYISTSPSSNPQSGYQISPSSYFFNNANIELATQSGYISSEANKLHIDEISVPAAGSYSVSATGDVLTFVPTVAGTYKFALYTYNRAGVVAPYFAPQHFEISFTVNPQIATQKIYYGQTAPLNVLSSISGWANITEDNSTKILDAAALSQGVLKMVNNANGVTYVDVKDAAGIALARVTVNAYSATAQTPTLNLTTTAANPKNMMNGESAVIYWNVNYTASDSTTYTLQEAVDSSAWSSVFVEHGNTLTLNNNLMTAVAGSVSGIAAYTAVHAASSTTEQVWVYIDATNTMVYNYVISSSNTSMIPVSSVTMQPGDLDTLYIWNANTNALVTGISLVASSNNVVAQASANGAAVVNVSALSNGSATVTVYPAAGGSVSLSVIVNTTVAPTYSVNGTVTDGTNPIANASIVITDVTNVTNTYSGSTDALGDFNISGIVDGTYAVTVSAMAHASINTNVTVSGGNENMGTIILTPQVTYQITGQVTDGTNPIVGASVSVTSVTGGGYTYTASTDSNGDFTVTGVPDGNYNVAFSATGFANTTQSVTVNGGDEIMGVISMTATGYTLTGRVVNASSAAISGATVSVNDGTTTYPTVTTDSNGDFTINGLGNGTYFITVTASGYDTNSGTSATINNNTANAGNIVMTRTPTGNTGGGGGGTITTYAITVSAGTGGKATASATTAAHNTVVTISATPDAGYAVDTVTAAAANGSTIPVNGSGVSYTFTMPASAVIVNVTFKTADIRHENCPSAPYLDVDQSLWYHEFIDYVIENGIMVGTGTNTFEPAANLSRAMMVRIFYNIEGQPATTGAVTFTDVSQGDWYYDAVAWASANDIVTGYGATAFGPNDNVTREQMVTMLYRYARYKSYDTSSRGDLSAFVDRDSVSDWAMDAMQWAVGTALVNGRDATHLAPTGTATRAEVATIMTKYCKYYSIF